VELGAAAEVVPLADMAARLRELAGAAPNTSPSQP
jgi:hypothetical protein